LSQASFTVNRGRAVVPRGKLSYRRSELSSEAASPAPSSTEGPQGNDGKPRTGTSGLARDTPVSRTSLQTTTVPSAVCSLSLAPQSYRSDLRARDKL